MHICVSRVCASDVDLYCLMSRRNKKSVFGTQLGMGDTFSKIEFIITNNNNNRIWYRDLGRVCLPATVYERPGIETIDIETHTPRMHSKYSTSANDEIYE